MTPAAGDGWRALSSAEGRFAPPPVRVKGFPETRPKMDRNRPELTPGCFLTGARLGHMLSGERSPTSAPSPWRTLVFETRAPRLRCRRGTRRRLPDRHRRRGRRRDPPRVPGQLLAEPP